MIRSNAFFVAQDAADRDVSKRVFQKLNSESDEAAMPAGPMIVGEDFAVFIAKSARNTRGEEAETDVEDSYQGCESAGGGPSESYTMKSASTSVYPTEITDSIMVLVAHFRGLKKIPTADIFYHFYRLQGYGLAMIVGEPGQVRALSVTATCNVELDDEEAVSLMEAFLSECCKPRAILPQEKNPVRKKELAMSSVMVTLLLEAGATVAMQVLLPWIQKKIQEYMNQSK